MEIKSGVLSKRGSGFPFNWLDRKFILYNDKIEYYAGTVLKGEFILTAESKVSCFPEASRSSTFRVSTRALDDSTRRTKDNELLLSASSDVEMAEWVEVLSKTIKNILTDNITNNAGSLQLTPEKTSVVTVSTAINHSGEALELWQNESTRPISKCNKHILDQISDYGFWKCGPDETLTATNIRSVHIPVEEKTRLYLSLSIMDITSIDPMNESFGCKFRMYLVWQVNLHAIGMGAVAEKAHVAGHSYNMSHDEILEFEEKGVVPVVSVFNSISHDETDAADIKVYCGLEGNTYVMWNKSYAVVCKERFELQDFPFDLQQLQMEFRLNDPRTWDLFNLSVHCVQMHKACLVLTEWGMLEPRVVRESPKHKVSVVQLEVLRFSWFYIQNVVLAMFVLSLLGPLAFVMDIDDIGSRIGNLLTLILTAVAFKFILAGSLPKVPYNTKLDYWILYASFMLACMAFFSVVPGILARNSPDFASNMNIILGAFSLGSIVFGLAFWYVWVYFSLSYTQHDPSGPIDVVKGKNWYAYHFAKVPFFGDYSNKGTPVAAK